MDGEKPKVGGREPKPLESIDPELERQMTILAEVVGANSDFWLRNPGRGGSFVSCVDKID